MQFSTFVEKTSLNSSLPYSFNFTLTYHSMSHAELAIAFALEWPIYLLLTCIIGVLAIIFSAVYHIFFRVANL